MPLTKQDALIVTGFLTSRQFGPAETIFADHDAETVTMLWILHGEVTVETPLPTPGYAMTLTVLEPGRALGEMAFMDGKGRSANCTACSEVRCAQLTRAAFQTLAAAHPPVAAKLMALIAMDLSARVRDVNDQLKRHVVMSDVMRAEQYRNAMPGVMTSGEN